MKRKAIDFTADYEINIVQSVANPGKFWSQIQQTGSGMGVWLQTDVSDTRADALCKAEYELDRRAEAWLEEGEPEDDGAGISEDEHSDRNGIPRSSR